MITLQQEYELENSALAIDPELIGGTVKSDYKDWLEQKITNLRVREYTIQKQSVEKQERMMADILFWRNKYRALLHKIEDIVNEFGGNPENALSCISEWIESEYESELNRFPAVVQDTNPSPQGDSQPPLTGQTQQNNEYKTNS
jgi:hypothetical protein